MRKRKLLWQLYPSYLVIAVLSLVAVSWYLSVSFREFHIEQTSANLEKTARLIKDHIPVPPDSGMADIDSLCKELGDEIGTRITLILPSGKVIGDAEEDPESMDNHADRPEVVEALSGKTGASIRYSFTLRQEMIYVAIPVEKNGRLSAVLRVSIPLVSVNRALGAVYVKIIIGFILVVVFLALVSYIIARRIKRPIDQLRTGADQFARGSLDRKIRIPDSLEFGALAESMNDMAAQLSDRIETTIRQREEQEAILSSMIEGVLAVDTEERIMIINDAAARLLEADAGESRGRSVQEAVRNVDIQRLIANVISSEKPIECQIRPRFDTDMILRAQGTVIRGESSMITGALVILHDITRITRLENMRRDFVANVSHELKTPVTAIKGFVETLADGAVAEPEEARKFLDIIIKHTDRLNATVDDLLQLSKIEQDVESKKIPLVNNPLKPVLLSAVDICQAKAAKMGMTLKVVCDDALRSEINSALLERAVVNLIDNAVNSSESGSEVRISVTYSGTETIIDVIDHGCGIEQKHHSRLFERFYRVDTARSRELGGTGLGLAIVKHIAEAHGGFASVKSRPGEGSIFSIHLPKA